MMTETNLDDDPVVEAALRVRGALDLLEHVINDSMAPSVCEVTTDAARELIRSADRWLDR